MKVSAQIEKITTSSKGNPKKYSKHFVAELLSMSRKTFYERLEGDSFSDEEKKILKENKIIS